MIQAQMGSGNWGGCEGDGGWAVGSLIGERQLDIVGFAVIRIIHWER
jgi:hypothetical protein